MEPFNAIYRDLLSEETNYLWSVSHKGKHFSIKVDLFPDRITPPEKQIEQIRAVITRHTKSYQIKRLSYLTINILDIDL